ncbi:MAG: imidazole glycerol phosphate synthase subunit HisH [Thermoplasmatota archaeon]
MKWALWDYGVGNLHSLRKAIEAIGEEAAITEDPQTFLEADVSVLPGVGAFGKVMESLAPIAPGLTNRHQAGRPILGVCIGMQVLYEGSDESPTPGLGIIPGHVHRLQARIVPHMGWNDVSTPMEGVYYYVHSYAAPSKGALASTKYGEQTFAAAVRDGNTIGFQFHPEKSGDAGRAILKWARDQYKEQA